MTDAQALELMIRVSRVNARAEVAFNTLAFVFKRTLASVPEEHRAREANILADHLKSWYDAQPQFESNNAVDDAFLFAREEIQRSMVAGIRGVNVG